MNNLPKYRRYKKNVDILRNEAIDLKTFSQTLKNDSHLKSLRNEAREELDAIYYLIKTHFGLPSIKIYTPIRKKIYTQGVAFCALGIPTEIRIYHIGGCTTKHPSSWRPTDLICRSSEEYFEIFVHEVAHILEAVRNGEMSHEKPFVNAYIDIERFLKENGFHHLFSPIYRLTGVPQNSYAHRASGGVGCLLALLTMTVLVVVITI